MVALTRIPGLQRTGGWLRDLCYSHRSHFLIPLRKMLASESCPLVEHRSQESEIGEKQGLELGLDIKIGGVEDLFEDLENGGPIDSCNLFDTLDPFHVRRSYDEVLDLESQDPSQFDHTLGFKLDEKVSDVEIHNKFTYGSGGIGLNSSSIQTILGGPTGGPRKNNFQILGDDVSWMMQPNCTDPINEVGTSNYNPSEGEPITPFGPEALSFPQK